MNRIKCKCGQPWQIQDNLSAYDGEVVLVCVNCGERYYNAQEWFSLEDLENLGHIKTKEAADDRS